VLKEAMDFFPQVDRQSTGAGHDFQETYIGELDYTELPKVCKAIMSCVFVNN
jgi:hypothetical protein